MFGWAKKSILAPVIMDRFQETFSDLAPSCGTKDCGIFALRTNCGMPRIPIIARAKRPGIIVFWINRIGPKNNFRIREQRQTSVASTSCALLDLLTVHVTMRDGLGRCKGTCCHSVAQRASSVAPQASIGTCGWAALFITRRPRKFLQFCDSTSSEILPHLKDLYI